MKRQKIKILRINSDRTVIEHVDRLVIEYLGDRYTITPDFDAIRVHKFGKDSALFQ